MPIDPTKLSKASDFGKTTKIQLSGIESRPDLVTVAFEGLGICCFAESRIIDRQPNKKTAPKSLEAGIPVSNIPQIPARCEIAIIRKTAAASRHLLTIAVWETTDGVNYALHNYPNHGEIKYGFDESSDLPDDIEISVKAVQNAQIGGYAKYKPTQTLNKQGKGNQDAYDLGWIVDIEGAGFHPNKLAARKANTKLSTMYIHNAEFYSRSFLKKSAENADPQPQTVSGLSTPIIIGHELGAKIPADKIRLTVKSIKGNIDDVFEFGAAGGKRYLIKVGNTCYSSSASNGDFDAIYEFLKDTSEHPAQFTLTPYLPSLLKTTIPQIPKPTPNPQAHAYVRFCGAYLAGKQDGIGAILAAQTVTNNNPTQ